MWIVGGGMAGLSTAAALRSTHLYGDTEIHVLERQSDLSSVTVGAAAQLGPNGLRALEWMGGPSLVERVLEEGSVVTHTGILLAGRKVMLIPEESRKEQGLPQVLIRWGILRQLLAELLPSECIHTSMGNGICGYKLEVDEHGKEDKVVLVNGDGEHVGPAGLALPSLLISADGINSPFQTIVRQDQTILVADESSAATQGPNVQDNGRVNIKAIVEMELDYDAFSLVDGEGKAVPQGTALAYSAPDGSIACFAGSAGKGYTYWAISIIDGKDSAGGKDRDGKLFGDDTVMSDSSQVGAIKVKLLDMLKSLNAQECRFAMDLIQATPANRIYARRSRQLTEVGPSFVSKDEKVVLVGDSAHAMSPSYGQGANFAFEDAATLGWCMQQHPNDRSKALDSYNTLRVGRCEEMVRRSAERATKQAKGTETDTVFSWISQWDLLT